MMSFRGGELVVNGAGCFLCADENNEAALRFHVEVCANQFHSVSFLLLLTSRLIYVTIGEDGAGRVSAPPLSTGRYRVACCAAAGAPFSMVS